MKTEKQIHGTRVIPHGALCLEESSWATMENPSPGSQPALNPASPSVVFHFPSLKVRPSMKGEPPL